MAKGRCVISLQHAVIGVVSLVLLMQRGEATTFVVGGTQGWTAPPNNSPVFNQWAEKMRFQVGDSLCKFLVFLFFPCYMFYFLFFFGLENQGRTRKFSSKGPFD